MIIIQKLKTTKRVTRNFLQTLRSCDTTTSVRIPIWVCIHTGTSSAISNKGILCRT